MAAAETRISRLTAERALKDWGELVRGGMPRATPSTSMMYRVMREGPETVAAGYGLQAANPEWPLYIRLTEAAITVNCCRRDQQIACGLYIFGRARQHVADDLNISPATLKIRIEIIQKVVGSALNMGQVAEMACAT